MLDQAFHEHQIITARYTLAKNSRKNTPSIYPRTSTTIVPHVVTESSTRNWVYGSWPGTKLSVKGHTQVSLGHDRSFQGLELG